MRELKFRIWDNLKKDWVSNKNIWRMKTDLNGIGEIHPNTFYWKQHPEGLTIQQYTGLKDKNGKEIYEGDILKVCGFLYDREDREEKPIGNFVMSFSSYNGSFYTYWLNKYPCEVIGNIFDNPELIK